VPPAYRVSQSIVRGQATSPYDDDGWFEPGDLGWIENGILFLNGRSSEVINVGGNKFSTHQLEEFVAKARGVINSAVVSETNAAGFDTVCVGLIAGPGFIPAHFDEILSRRIGKISPRKLLVLDELPLLASGKVDKPKLKSFFAAVDHYGTRSLSD
jgi:acyl-coenzyme A synthetase/AMP-(fatty) acid ligase